MKLIEKFGIASILYLLIFPSPSTTTRSTNYDEVSIYNIHYGTLIYTYWDGANKNVHVAYPQQLNDRSYPERATWRKIYNSDGTISFESVVHPSLCLTYYYSTGYDLTQEECIYDPSPKQRFNIEPTESGAYLLKFVSAPDECVHADSSQVTWFLRSERCVKDDDKFLWALIPPKPYSIQRIESKRVWFTVPTIPDLDIHSLYVENDEKYIL